MVDGVSCNLGECSRNVNQEFLAGRNNDSVLFCFILMNLIDDSWN